MLIKSPCLNCADRTRTCKFEGQCGKWAKYRAEIDAQHEANKYEADWIGARVDSINRRKHKKNARYRFR